MNLYFKTFEGDVNGSWDLVLRITLKVCESDVVSAIGSFHFRGDDFVIRAPDIRGYDYVVDTDAELKYELMSGPDAIGNKLAGLYVLKEEESKKVEYNNEIETYYYVKPGINGIRKGINRSKSLYKDSKFFEFSIPVIWEMNKHGRMYEDRVFKIINNERDCIYGYCNSKECSFSFYSFNENNLETYNDPKFINHLNGMQKILDNMVAGKFEVRLQIENLGQRLDPIEFGILNRNQQGFYSVEDQVFEKALDRFNQRLIKHSQEETKKLMQKIDDDIAKYKEMEIEDNFRAKEKCERLQELKNVMETLSRYVNLEEETHERERKEKSD